MENLIGYPNEFRQEALNQVVVHGFPVPKVSKFLRNPNKSLYDWIEKFSEAVTFRKKECQ